MTHLLDANNILDDHLALLKGHVGEPLVASDGLVGQQANHHVTQRLGLLNNAYVTGRDQIGAHRDIDGFHWGLFPSLLLHNGLPIVVT